MEYGLALSGGGARGAYHTGVYRALEEMGICPRAVTGTSIGAVTGALIASGETSSLRSLWKSLSFEAITGEPKPGLSMIGGCDTSVLYGIIKSAVNEKKVRQSKIHFGFEVLDGHRNTELFIENVPEGRLAEYLTAAVCLPIFKPRPIDGRKLIDGGIIDNMPVDMLIDDGIKNIIASDDSGIGRIRRITKSDVNIINVKYKKPESGILDFDRRRTLRSVQYGYYDCRRAFGDISGEIYCFENGDYLCAAHRLGKRLIRSIEKAALMCGIDRLRMYSVDALALRLADEYRRSGAARRAALNSRFGCAVRYIEKNYP